MKKKINIILFIFLSVSVFANEKTNNDFQISEDFAWAWFEFSNRIDNPSLLCVPIKTLPKTDILKSFPKKDNNVEVNFKGIDLFSKEANFLIGKKIFYNQKWFPNPYEFINHESVCANVIYNVNLKQTKVPFPRILFPALHPSPKSSVHSSGLDGKLLPEERPYSHFWQGSRIFMTTMGIVLIAPDTNAYLIKIPPESFIFDSEFKGSLAPMLLNNNIILGKEANSWPKLRSSCQFGNYIYVSSISGKVGKIMIKGTPKWESMLTPFSEEQVLYFLTNKENLFALCNSSKGWVYRKSKDGKKWEAQKSLPFKKTEEPIFIKTHFMFTIDNANILSFWKGKLANLKKIKEIKLKENEILVDIAIPSDETLYLLTGVEGATKDYKKMRMSFRKESIKAE